MNVVIADDSRAMRMLVRKTLRDAGFTKTEIREASDGQEALTLVREWMPDLVMTDWNMPNMGGLELLQALKAESFTGKAVVVSSAASPDMLVTAAEAGAESVIQKPFTPERFQNTLVRIGFKPNADANIEQGVADAIDLSPKGIAAALSRAYRRPLKVTEGAPINMRAPKLCYGIYEDNGELCGLVAMEMEIAGNLGAALSLIPKTVVPDFVAGKVQPEVKENVHEVFNLLSRVVGVDGRAAKLTEVHIGQELPIYLRAFARKKSERVNVMLDLQGYGNGRAQIARIA